MGESNFQSLSETATISKIGTTSVINLRTKCSNVCANRLGFFSHVLERDSKISWRCYLDSTCRHKTTEALLGPYQKSVENHPNFDRKMQPKSPKLHGNLNLKVTCEVHIEMKKMHEHICSHRSYQYNYLTYRSYLPMRSTLALASVNDSRFCINTVGSSREYAPILAC